MANIKLNPLVDLGLASDPSYKPNPNDNQEQVINVETDSLAYATTSQPVAPIETVPAMPTSAPVNTSSTTSTNTFAGIQDLTSFTPQHTGIAKPINDNASTPVAVSSNGKNTALMSNSLLIIAAVLFLVSLGALIFFLLRYFRVV